MRDTAEVNTSRSAYRLYGTQDKGVCTGSETNTVGTAENTWEEEKDCRKWHVLWLQMETTQETDIKRWTCPKPKQRQKKCESDAMRSLSETPMLFWSQRFQDQGLRRKAVSQDNIKIRSHSRPNAMESKPHDPDLELHPQPNRPFSAEEAVRVIKSILDEELKDYDYDATTSQHRAMELAELVKTAVRDLGYERYKLVCFVAMGPVSQGTIYCCSRSVWSPNSDTYAEYLFQNHSVFALCVVYAGYYE